MRVPSCDHGGGMLNAAFSDVTTVGLPAEWKNLQERIDPSWIAMALMMSGVATLRKRRLPAEQVVWLVIGMALYRDRSIDRVVASLDLALPGESDLPARSGIAQARARLGAEPLQYLFEITAQHWGHESARRHAWRGLALYGYDGSTVAVPDTPENREALGAQSNGKYGDAAYPSVRVVALKSVGDDAALRRTTQGEKLSWSVQLGTAE